MIKVIVAEENYIFRKGLVSVLNEIKNVEIKSEVSDVSSLIDILKTSKVDILFLSICNHGPNAVEIAKQVLEIMPGLRVVALALECENNFVYEMLNAGVYGYILKNVDRIDVEKAINSVMNYRYFFSSEVMSVLTDRLMKKESNCEKDLFNEKEKKLLELMCKGYSTNIISQELNISPRTCEGYRCKMISKVNVENSVGLVVFAIRNGYVKV